MSFDCLIERYMDQEGLSSSEGSRGVRNLAKLVNALGYRDFNRYGQQQDGYCIGDILAFLEDNSGAIDALVDWIKARNVPEWVETVENQLQNNADSDLVTDHFKECPDCGSEIPSDAIRGEECENCGHVFNWGPVDDPEWDEMEPLFPNGTPDRI